MSAPVFIGDELTAAGYRLAGAVTRTPAAGEEASLLQWARDSSDLVLISAVCAARIPRAILQPWLAAPQPLLLVVCDARGEMEMPDSGARIQALLGLGA